MGDLFKKVRAGEPLQIQAETFNAFVDAARHHRQTQQSMTTETKEARPDANRTKLRNQTGADRRRYEVLRIGQPLIGPADNLLEYLNHTSFAGVAIEEDDEDRIAILQEPCPPNAIREAIHSGVSIVRLTGETGLRRATTREDDYVLEASNQGPFTILHDPGPADHERLAVVRFGAPRGNETVFFEITRFCEEEPEPDSEGCGCGGNAVCYEARVLYEACGTEAPDTIELRDLCQLVGNEDSESPEELIGRRGVATLMRPKSQELTDDKNCCCWVVVSLCSPEEDSSGQSSEGSEDSSGIDSEESSASSDSEGSDESSAGDSEESSTDSGPDSEGSGSEGSEGSEGSGSHDSGSGESDSDGSDSEGSEDSGSGSDGSGSDSGSGGDSGSGSEGSDGSGSDESGDSGSEGSDGSDESGSDGSGSDDSGSDSSGSDSSGSSGSSDSSGADSSGEDSGSGSGDSEGPESDSSGSGKDTAIVPASWSPTGYAALFVTESPEVRFEEVIVIEVPQSDSLISIDPRFVEVCVPGSLEVGGCQPDVPVLVGAKVEGSHVKITFAEESHHPVRLVVRLTGIRRGFAGVRFPARTAEQFAANERFIRSAYPHE